VLFDTLQNEKGKNLNYVSSQQKVKITLKYSRITLVHGSDIIDKSQQENYKNVSGKAGAETLRTYAEDIALGNFQERTTPPTNAS
jgi:hypothetical protein